MPPQKSNEFSRFTNIPAASTLQEMQTTAEGLSGAEAAARLARHGRNEIQAREETWRELIIRQFKSPFIYLLVAAAVVSFFLGERIDALFILLFVLVNTILGFSQEYRSAKALQLLRQYVVGRTTVQRDGQPIVVPTPEVVPGDIIALAPGDIVAADIRLLSDDDLVINESTLTGESIMVTKDAAPSPQPVTEPYQATNIIFAGTTVTSGRGVGVVIATASHTALGVISRLTIETSHVTSFEKGIAGFSRFIMRLILMTLVLVFVANIIIKGDSVNIFQLMIFSIALAISVIPEALPVVTTLAMSRGAVTLAKKKVVVKRLSAIEDLGGIDVLCTDKTGTITAGVMTVDSVHGQSRTAILVAAVAGSSHLETGVAMSNNAFDRAIWSAMTPAEQAAATTAELRHELPFDPERKRATVVVQTDNGLSMISRGAPEVIIEQCQLTGAEQQHLLAEIQAAGQSGLRILGVAERRLAAAPSQDDLRHDTQLTWIGWIGLRDPLKASAAAAVADARQLGVGVKIVTGDAPDVAGQVAHAIGLIAKPDEVLTGAQLDQLPAGEQAVAVEHFQVFARVSPEQKFRIIELLRKQHQVGYLGEGINDAPALKEANVSLVVDTASDIARSNADVILLQSDLSVIIEGIRQGRIVFANTIKYIKSTLLSNFGNFYAVAFASLLIAYPPILPLQILLINLLSDFPMISIATDTVDPTEVAKPRVYNVREVALLATVLGAVSTFFDFLFFGIFSHISPGVLQTNWFIGSILTELAILYSIRTRLPFYRAVRPSPMIFWLTIVAAVITVALPYTAFGQSAFHFIPPTLKFMAWTVGIVIAYFFTTEIVKRQYYRWRHQLVEV